MWGVDMRYRKAEQKDCEEIHRLICILEEKCLPWEAFLRIYQTQMCDSHYECLICEEDAHVVGVLNLRLEQQLHHCERIAEIMEFAVAPAYRGQGIGKELLSLACQRAKDLDCTQIEAACNQLRLDTHRFYLREGMHNFHFKFSKSLTGDISAENVLGK